MRKASFCEKISKTDVNSDFYISLSHPFSKSKEFLIIIYPIPW